ncbi:hypothetical protein Zmor_004311 [Zophobas morio]|uniref:L-arabinose isomerase C-terminal domain-containing protein n=1 Tax=Zophobas morio TaxID=2755281 RepID=A0AA38HJD2_9CUCU|nr:hypothetical protein Zmor_004311 [Zophobas morio]
MANNKKTGFMEDYTYHFDGEEGLILGAHMLEVCPTLASNKPEVIVKPLGIGGKTDPARVIFKGSTGKGICVSLIDKRDNFEMVATDIESVEQVNDMPELPVGKML